MIPHLVLICEKLLVATLEQTSRTSPILAFFVFKSVIVVEYPSAAFVCRTLKLEIRELVFNNLVKFFLNKKFATSTWTLWVVLFPLTQTSTAKQALTSIALDWSIHDAEASFADKIIEHLLGFN